jgi:hypothetical protein
MTGGCPDDEAQADAEPAQASASGRYANESLATRHPANSEKSRGTPPTIRHVRERLPHGFRGCKHDVGPVRRARGPDFGDLRPVPTRSGDSGGSDGDGTARPGLWMVRQGFDNRGMSDPVEFYRTFQSLLRGRAIAGVLTSGMACVEYGIQQNTKDTDWIVAPADIAGLITLFGDLERGLSGPGWRISYRGLFGAPLDPDYLAGGWTSHIAAFDQPDSAERHLDFFGRPPRVGDAWRVDTAAGIASRDVVARMKKTDRPKDWPLVNALAIQAHYTGDSRAVLHLRDADILREAWRAVNEADRNSAVRERPLLRGLDAWDDLRLERLLLVEGMLWQCVNRERYLVYQRAWKEFYRSWQQDRIGEWPTSEPFLQQHRRVCDAARQHGLPPAPLGSADARQAVYDRGRARAQALAAATREEMETVAVPLDAMLP